MLIFSWAPAEVEAELKQQVYSVEVELKQLVDWLEAHLQ